MEVWCTDLLSKENLSKEVQLNHSLQVQVPSNYAKREHEPRPHVSCMVLSQRVWQWQKSLSFEAEQDSSKSSLSNEASHEVNWDFLSCTAVWVLPYPILWPSFSLSQEPELYHSWKAFFGCSCPLYLFMFHSYFFFQYIFWGFVLFWFGLGFFALLTQWLLLPKRTNWHDWHWKWFMISANKMEFGNWIICHLPEMRIPSQVVYGSWIVSGTKQQSSW